MDSRYGAVVLCGGQSARMGRDKATLPFGPHTLLEHIVGVLHLVVPPRHVVVVAARDQELPALGDGSIVVHDRGNGPLTALVEGLWHLPTGVESAVACGCDAPLLQPAFLRRLLELLTPEVDAVVPADEQRWYPLAAAYSVRSLAGLSTAIAAGEQSLHRALGDVHIHTRTVPTSQLRDADPELLSLINCNTPAEYAAAQRRAGLAE